jgi:hypothetical protein
VGKLKAKGNDEHFVVVNLSRKLLFALQAPLMNPLLLSWLCCEPLRGLLLLLVAW